MKPEAIIVAADDRGVIQLFNIGAERLLGYGAAEVVEILSPSDLHETSYGTPDPLGPRQASSHTLYAEFLVTVSIGGQ